MEEGGATSGGVCFIYTLFQIVYEIYIGTLGSWPCYYDGWYCRDVKTIRLWE